MKLQPLNDRVIVKADEAEEKTSGGLILTSDSKEKPVTGKVLAVGDGIIGPDGKKVPIPVKVGDKVLYGKFGGTEVTIDGEELLILRSEDIYAVFK